MKREWRAIERGQAVELKGKRYVVTKVKVDGKRARVTVMGALGEFKAEVRAKDMVKVLTSSSKKPEALHDRAGAQQRWATDAEAKRSQLPPGDPALTTPPKPATGKPWTTHADKLERALAAGGARLIGEATDEGQGYYVPPVDVTTVAGHLALFHGTDTSQYGVDDLLELHEVAHASSTAVFETAHWHTENRPKG